MKAVLADTAIKKALVSMAPTFDTGGEFVFRHLSPLGSVGLPNLSALKANSPPVSKLDAAGEFGSKAKGRWKCSTN